MRDSSAVTSIRSAGVNFDTTGTVLLGFSGKMTTAGTQQLLQWHGADVCRSIESDSKGKLIEVEHSSSGQANGYAIGSTPVQTDDALLPGNIFAI